METFRLPIRLIRNKYGRGALNAVKTGLESCSSQTAVAVIMADLSDDLNDVNAMYRAHRRWYSSTSCAAPATCVAGGRSAGRPSRASCRELPAFRFTFSRGFRRTMRPIISRCTGARLSRLTQIQSQAGFEIGLEMVVKAYVGGYRIGEIPTTWHDRVAGTSRFNIRKWLPHYLRWYRYAFRRRAASPNS